MSVEAALSRTTTDTGESRTALGGSAPSLGSVPGPNGHRPAGPAIRRDIGVAGLSALILGGLLHLRYGYFSGLADHLVLSPVGLQRVHPEWFANDWAVANAPQPHWLFDVVTWFGATIGNVGAVYLVYWLAALAVFGLATALLANAWAPRHRWLAAIAVSTAAAATPWYLLGTGLPTFPIAVPGVLGGFLLYLTVVSLLTDRPRLAVGATIALCFIHVQQGAVGTILLAAVAVVESWRRRRVDRLLVAGAVAGVVVVVVALQIRPIAGHFSDFAEACNSLIPFHCNASSWRRTDARGGLAIVGLALMTLAYLVRDRTRWLRWGAIVVLPTVTLLAGLAFDRWNIPTLGVIAQGLNIYRLGVLLLPLALWGLLSPVLADLTPRLRWVALGFVLVLGHSALRQSGWGLEPSNDPWMLIVAGALVLGCAALTVPGLTRRPGRVVGAALALIALAVVGSGVQGAVLKVRPFDTQLVNDNELRTWGQAVERVVPVGEQILAPPTTLYTRMVTKRAVIVDCKYGPYGGPAWREFKERLNALGGTRDCLSRTRNFDALAPGYVTEVAQRYGADYMVVEPKQQWRLASLVSIGWTVVLGPVGKVDNYVLQAPWA